MVIITIAIYLRTHSRHDTHAHSDTAVSDASTDAQSDVLCLSGALHDNPSGVRQREGHQRVHDKQPEAKSDLYHRQGVQEASSLGDNIARRLRRSLEHVAGARGLASRSG